MTPAPAPRPGCPSPAARALSPSAAPSLLPPSPALPPSLRRRLCLNFRGRSRRRREAGAGPAPASAPAPAPAGSIPSPSRTEPPPHPASLGRMRRPRADGDRGQHRPRRGEQVPPPRDSSPGLLSGVPRPLPVRRWGPGAAAPPSFPPSSRTAGAPRFGQLPGSIPRRCRCLEPVPGASRSGRRVPAGKSRRGRGGLGVCRVSPPGRFRARTPRTCGVPAGDTGRGCGRKGRKRRRESGLGGNLQGGPFGWARPFPRRSHDSAVPYR